MSNLSAVLHPPVREREAPAIAPGAAEVRAYYRRILPFFDRELTGRGDGAFWTWAAGSPPGCRVLELGAGTGRATAFLARSAGRVVAFDLSLDLAAVARRRLAGCPHVHLLVADMRAPAVAGPAPPRRGSPADRLPGLALDPGLDARRGRRLDSGFDLVAAVDDPFVHLTGEEDRTRAFVAAAERVGPGGRFLLDAAWFPPQQREAAGGREGLVLEREGSGGLAIREVWSCDPETRLCSARYEYRLRGREVEQATFAGRLWSTGELEKRAGACGLEVANLWGDYDRRPWDRATSRRLIAELRRPGRGPARHRGDA